MSVIKYEVRQGAYFDSVVLMQLQKGLAALEGVEDAGVVMATPANRELLAASGLLPDGVTAQADDLLLVVKAVNGMAAAAALAEVDTLLARRQSAVTHDYRPRSLQAAVQALPDAALVLVSVPGRYAAGVAEEALDLGKHVFLYSDNVPLADEVRLKRKAKEKGLLVMGPDCGTAVINNIGLGFSNRVRPGQVGIVAASGTGLQAVSAEVHNLGGGISQAIGTGGRDLKEEVGGITAMMALDMLRRDRQTRVIALISKPPSAKAANRLLRAAQATGKQVVVNFIGMPSPGHQVGNLHFTTSLYETAELAVHLSHTGDTGLLSQQREPFAGYVRGLFSGGTLAYEALLGFTAVLEPVYSNVPIYPQQKLDDVTRSKGHTILDMGEDDFTQGRLHPMMDNDLRLRRIRQEAADPEVGFILLDVVLGDGAHPNPAQELSPAIAEAREAGKKVLVVVVGTDEDPQDLNEQIEQLAAAGAIILPNTLEAVDYVFNRQSAPSFDFVPVDMGAFGSSLAAINVGVGSFYESLIRQGATAVQVDWRPPAGGNEKLMAILAKMKGRD